VIPAEIRWFWGIFRKKPKTPSEILFKKSCSATTSSGTRESLQDSTVLKENMILGAASE
jgi:hypothetical protein